MIPEPTIRKPLGILMILGLIAVWAWGVGSLSGLLGNWPVLAQGLFYLMAGTAWILPLRPLLVWMETGRFRPPSD
jgi:Protein of unknown function (DUF2842)